MTKLLLSTGNAGKVNELRELLAAAGAEAEVLSLKDFPAFVAPEEDGDTFHENALIKARAAAKFTGLIALADDSGLCVDALSGAPGVYSARFSGEGATDEKNNALLLEKLRNTPTEARTAYFMSAVAMVTPDGKETVTQGKAQGIILTEQKGTGGFGYDPLFYVPELGKTFAELTMEEKNRISHRGNAFRAMLPHILEVL